MDVQSTYNPIDYHLLRPYNMATTANIPTADVRMAQYCILYATSLMAKSMHHALLFLENLHLRDVQHYALLFLENLHLRDVQHYV